MLLTSSLVYADSGPGAWSLKVGGALNQPTLVTNKLIGLGYTKPLTPLLDYQLEGGLFTDLASASVTGFAGPSIGITMVEPTYYLKVFFGPTLITRTDNYLSSIYEFKTDLELGIYDGRNIGVGIGYTHMSNAGLVSPNHGRDFLYIKITLP
jgi:hypothetical protein